jgi:hypothetical protein
MKHYSPTGGRNHGRPLNRLTDTWDRNGSTSGPTPWQIYDDDDFHIVYVPVSFINESTRMILARHFECNVTIWREVSEGIPEIRDYLVGEGIEEMILKWIVWEYDEECGPSSAGWRLQYDSPSVVSTIPSLNFL